MELNIIFSDAFKDRQLKFPLQIYCDVCASSLCFVRVSDGQVLKEIPLFSKVSCVSFSFCIFSLSFFPVLWQLNICSITHFVRLTVLWFFCALILVDVVILIYLSKLYLNPQINNTVSSYWTKNTWGVKVWGTKIIIYRYAVPV